MTDKMEKQSEFGYIHYSEITCDLLTAFLISLLSLLRAKLNELLGYWENIGARNLNVVLVLCHVNLILF